MIFLILFSYVILCDFYPLYHFERDKCLIGTEENLNRETFVDTTLKSNDEIYLKISFRKNVSESLKYGSDPRPHPSFTELILTFWIFTLFCEEIRQVKSLFIKKQIN